MAVIRWPPSGSIYAGRHWAKRHLCVGHWANAFWPNPLAAEWQHLCRKVAETAGRHQRLARGKSHQARGAIGAQRPSGREKPSGLKGHRAREAIGAQRPSGQGMPSGHKGHQGEVC